MTLPRVPTNAAGVPKPSSPGDNGKALSVTGAVPSWATQSGNAGVSEQPWADIPSTTGGTTNLVYDPTTGLLLRSSGGGIYRSSDKGLTWTADTISPATSATFYLCYGSGVMMAAGKNYIWTRNPSNNTWTHVKQTSTSTSENCTYIGCNNNKWLVVSSGNGFNGYFHYCVLDPTKTTSGGDWVKVNSPLTLFNSNTENVASITYNGAVIWFVATANMSGSVRSVIRSTDYGATWSQPSGITLNVGANTYFNPKWICHARGITLMCLAFKTGATAMFRSTNGGAAWTAVSQFPGLLADSGSNFEGTPTSVHFARNKFIAFGGGGIFVSDDMGLTWRRTQSISWQGLGTTRYSIDYGHGQWIACYGNGGTKVSKSGYEWNDMTPSTSFLDLQYRPEVAKWFGFPSGTLNNMKHYYPSTEQLMKGNLVDLQFVSNPKGSTV